MRFSIELYEEGNKLKYTDLFLPNKEDSFTTLKYLFYYTDLDSLDVNVDLPDSLFNDIFSIDTIRLGFSVPSATKGVLYLNRIYYGINDIINIFLLASSNIHGISSSYYSSYLLHNELNYKLHDEAVLGGILEYVSNFNKCTRYRLTTNDIDIDDNIWNLILENSSKEDGLLLDFSCKDGVLLPDNVTSDLDLVSRHILTAIGFKKINYQVDITLKDQLLHLVELDNWFLRNNFIPYYTSDTLNKIRDYITESDKVTLNLSFLSNFSDLSDTFNSDNQTDVLNLFMPKRCTYFTYADVVNKPSIFGSKVYKSSGTHSLTFRFKWDAENEVLDAVLVGNSIQIDDKFIDTNKIFLPLDSYALSLTDSYTDKFLLAANKVYNTYSRDAGDLLHLTACSSSLIPRYPALGKNNLSGTLSVLVAVLDNALHILESNIEGVSDVGLIDYMANLFVDKISYKRLRITNSLINERYKDLVSKYSSAKSILCMEDFSWN